MRHLIDSYIRAEETLSLSSFENMSLVEILVKEGQLLWIICLKE